MTQTHHNGATLGFERNLWAAADALRGSMDAAEYKHVVLGLIFLKYISDAFEEYRAQLEAERAEGADPEDPDEYHAQNIFWVPPEARWSAIQARARQPEIGQVIDEAMTAIERDNPALKGVLPKEYARPALDKQRLGQLVDLITNIPLGDQAAQEKDILGRVYEYFLSQFDSAEGKKGGEFYTPQCVAKLLVEMIEPYRGRVYDPCFGYGGVFVQSINFIRAHATGNGNGGRARADISIYGQESNYNTWRLCKMNLAIRGIDGQIAHGDSFHDDRFPDRLVPSELGEIPEGWKVGKLDNGAENPRRGLQPHEIAPKTPYIALEHMPKRCIALSDWGTSDGIESNKFEFKRGEILFGKLRPYLHRVGVVPVDGVCSTDIVVVTQRRPAWFGFVLGHVSSVEFVEYTNAGSTGTKMPRTSWNEMARYKLVLLPESVAEAFTSLIWPLIECIIVLIHESRALAALRDALLPKLIRGEIRVKDAEKFLKERGL